MENSSFARVVPGSDEPEGWYVASWGVPYVAVVSAAAYDGDGLGLSQTAEGDSYFLYLDVTVVPGTCYLLTGWVNVSDRRAGSYKVEVLPQTAYGGSAGWVAPIGYFAPTGGWQSFQVEAVAPPTAAKFRIQLRVDGLRGVVYTDAISLVAVR